MPRVTEAHRQARRDEIAEAALRVLARNGVSATSIAQIVEESGLSAGAIYANFANKAELARYIASVLFEWRIARIQRLAEDGTTTPVEAMRALLSAAETDAPPVGLLLQFWAEATNDEELHAVLVEKMELLHSAFRDVVLAWARERAPEDAEALATRTARTMVAMCQGFLVNRALLGWVSADDYLATAESLLR
jgi:TetR/AcrR family transcriptional regulator, transcriptional repressor of aconitase